MISEILESAGFIEKITYQAARFRKPPASTFVNYFDDVESVGADQVNLGRWHHVSLELYATDEIDEQAEKRIEAELDSRALDWEKDAAFWKTDMQRFQTVYSFSYFEKLKRG